MDGGGGRVGEGSRLGFGATDLGAQMRCGRCRARAGDTQTHTGGDGIFTRGKKVVAWLILISYSQLMLFESRQYGYIFASSKL
jgi:hypothetical protein